MDKPIEIMRLLRTPPQGQLRFEVRGKQFSKISDIPDERVRKVLRKTIADLIRDCCDPEDLAAMNLIDGEAQPGGDPQNQQAVDDFLNSLQTDVSSPEQPLADVGTTTQEVRSDSLLDRFRSRSQVEPDNEPILKPINIAGQIHQLVQEQKVNFPELADRSILIRPDQYGGLRILVDRQEFDDVAQISDPQVRMVIKSAIQIWENRN